MKTTSKGVFVCWTSGIGGIVERRAAALGSRDFPKSLCFMLFWFGLEILRLVYKKGFFKYWTVSILFYLFTSKKLGAKGNKRSRILRWFHECVDLLGQEVSKFFFRIALFTKICQCLKNQFFCTFFFPFTKLKTFFCTFLKSVQNSAS